jgi:hypothetical protein
MNVLKYFAFALILCSAFYSAQATSQPSSQPPNMMDTLNKEAKASDPAGIHNYSQQLIQMFPAVRGGGDAYADSLTERLAKAELLAKQKKRKLISEAEIAQAFNLLVRETGAPDLLRADIETVHKNRAGFANALPAMISLKSNGSYCNPGEAVYLLELLIANIGRPTVSFSQSDHKPYTSVGSPPTVEGNLDLFCARHSQTEVAKIFNHLFKVFQI